MQWLQWYHMTRKIIQPTQEWIQNVVYNHGMDMGQSGTSNEQSEQKLEGLNRKGGSVLVYTGWISVPEGNDW